MASQTLKTTLKTTLTTTVLTSLCVSPVLAAEPNALRDDQASISGERVARVEVSSTSAVSEQGRRVYSAANLFDGHDWSAWGSAPANANGAWVRVGFDRVQYIDRLEYVPGDARTPTSFSQCGRPQRLRIETPTESRTVDLADRKWQQVVSLSPPIATDKLSLVFESHHGKGAQGGVCLSEIKLAGPKDPFTAIPELRARIETSIADLADDGRAHRGQRELLRIGPPAVAQLIAALDVTNSNQAARVASLLGELGDERATEVLDGLTRHSAPAVRESALWGLGALGSAAHYDAIVKWYDASAGRSKDRAFDALARSGNVRALEIIIAALVGGHAERRLSAEANLGRFGQDGIFAVKPLLVSSVKSERVAALRALGTVDMPEARELLYSHLPAAIGSELRAAAIFALSTRGDAAAHTAIASLWDSRYLVERQAVAHALGQFADPGDRELVELLAADLSMSVRQAAARSLARMGSEARPALQRLATRGPCGGTALAAAEGLFGPDASDEEVLLLLGSRHEEVRTRAGSVLAERGAAGEAILAAALVSPQGELRAAASKALGKIGARSVVAIIERTDRAPKESHADVLRLVTSFRHPLAADFSARLVRDGHDFVVRRMAVEAVAACADPQAATTALIGALGDSSVEVRQAAIVAIGERKLDGAIPALLIQLDGPQRAVVRSAIVALGQLKAAAAIDALTSLFHGKALPGSQDPGLREDVVDALGRIGGDRSLVLLMAAVADEDVRVRYAAQDALE